MKNLNTIICMVAILFATMVCIPIAKGQSVTKFPTIVTNIASGNSKLWVNPQNIASQYNGAATVNLAKNAICNATKCFQSASLQGTGMGKDLTAADSVVGIKVTIRAKSSNANSIKDLSIQVANWNNVIGTPVNKAKNSFWNTAYSLRTYGGPNDMWSLQGIPWLEINQPDFGVRISCQNLNTSSSSTAFIDYVKITVYYTNGARLMSQTRDVEIVNDSWQVFPNPVTDNLNLSVNRDITNPEIKIFNLNGEIVFEKSEVTLNENEPLQIDVATLPKGIYLMKIFVQEESVTKRFVKE